jgi:hypothetical protein
MADSIKTTRYKPGQWVPKAGIYKVSHAGHRLPHKARFNAHQKFPSCSKCTALVRFELLHATEDGNGQGNGHGNHH